MSWLTKPLAILRMEGLSELVLGTAVYAAYRPTSGRGWGFFLATVFLPDLFMAGYAKSTRIGAITYNFGHTTTVPVALLLAGLFAPPTVPLLHNNKVGLVTAGIVWACHIAMDRFFGFGLKFPDAFAHTHLGMIKDGGKSLHWDVDKEW
ncbi:hypothetical protein DFJ74DRAFT_679473 [Hyaloraphidium curvatum]|nr:hypothetical protein DFJ74DRAFT_679473 [Hyaloraphidium curvatum]